MVIPVDRERHERRLVIRLQRWLKGADELIGDCFDDARSHAERACTEALKNTTDGRPTAIKARTSRSLLAAEKKLRLLLTALTGRSVVSLDGCIQHAREDFYVDSYPIWWGATEPEFRASSPDPTEASIRAIRASLWNGSLLRPAFETVVDSAISSLRASVTQASLSEITWKTSTQILDTWESNRRATVFASVRLCLSASDKQADRQAMMDAIAPRFRAKPGSSIPGS